jgi:hypothetical protein
MLTRRIKALVEAGELEREIAQRLIEDNQANDLNRAGICFCFFPPRLSGERGIERFFRHWGGEALYNSHERNPVTSPAIRYIGTPSLIEVDVPVPLLKSGTGLAFNIVRCFLVWRGYRTDEPGSTMKNADAPVVKREAEDDWGKEKPS